MLLQFVLVLVMITWCSCHREPRRVPWVDRKFHLYNVDAKKAETLDNVLKNAGYVTPLPKTTFPPNLEGLDSEALLALEDSNDILLGDFVPHELFSSEGTLGGSVGTERDKSTWFDGPTAPEPDEER